MSWLYSQALVEGYSEGISLDGAPCALWNGTHTQPLSWCSDRTMAACRLSQSGTTFKPLTDNRGEAVLTSFLEAFPVRTSAPPEKEQESTERDQVCGDTWQELLVKYDLASSSWKTHHCLWEEDLQESSVTLPKWGMMRDGVLWERTTLPPLTSGTESGLWHTPTCHNAKEAGYPAEYKRKTPTLAAEAIMGMPAKMWPTPSANEDAAGTPDGKMQRMLGNHLDIRGTTQKEWSRGTLNPTWVEWLMGWPVGWTDLNALETDKCRSAQR